jgi:glucose/arabinose dehydrogenase
MIWSSLAIAGAMLVSPALAQSAREAAVAIDRIEIPAVDDVVVERLATGLHKPWSLAFLPDGSMLVTEKHRGLRLRRADGSLSGHLPGGPANLLADSDSGLLDVAPDPDFAENRMVYIAFAEGTKAENRTAIWKARLDGERLTGGRVIFRVNVAKKDSAHPGGRMLFLPDKTLLLSVGDGFDYRDASQDMGSHLGKLLRLTREGAAAPGNPFVGKAGVAPEIWSSGHRNIQGLALDPETKQVWAHEHGPRGGDEINLIEPGRNYGWPAVSHGIDYDGKIITERAHGPGFEGSRFIWSPSIAPSGLAIYRGAPFPTWNGRFLVGGLASRSLHRVRIGPGTPLLTEEARMLAGLRKRIRDVRMGPDGYIYLLTDFLDSEEPSAQLLRLRPSAPK